MGRFEMRGLGSGKVLGVFSAVSKEAALKAGLVTWLIAGKPQVELRAVEPVDRDLWFQRGADCHSATYMPAGHDGGPLGEIMESGIQPAIEAMYEEELEGLAMLDQPEALAAACRGYRASHELHGGTIYDRPSHVPPQPLQNAA